MMQDNVAFFYELKEWVEIESPSTDSTALAIMADRVEASCRQAQLAVERVPVSADGRSVIIARSHPHRSEPGIVVLAHYDTVHPVGTLAYSPMRQYGDRVYGPGIYDMKSCGLMAVCAENLIGID